VLLAGRLLPESRARTSSRGLDLPGAVTVTGGLALAVLGLTRAEQAGPGHPSAWLSLAAAALLLAAFARIERRAPDPLLPPGTLANRDLSGALLAAVVITAASTGPLFLCVLYLQDVLGRPATEAGALFAPVNLAVIAGSIGGARLVSRLGARTAMAAGLTVLAGGVLVLMAVPDSGGVPAFLPFAFVAIGAGLGFASVASTASGTGAVDRDHQGLASGLLNTAAQLGNALGLAVFVVLASAVSGPGEPVSGYRWAFAAAAALALGGAAAARALHRAR
jgi:predicted MFS family arabinose efflux permease